MKAEPLLDGGSGKHRTKDTVTTEKVARVSSPVPQPPRSLASTPAEAHYRGDETHGIDKPDQTTREIHRQTIEDRSHPGLRPPQLTTSTMVTGESTPRLRIENR